MAILSFAHLKNKNTPERPKQEVIVPSRAVPPVRTGGGVMSFAHLKNKKEAPVKQIVVTEPNITVTEPKVEPKTEPPQRTTYLHPRVMPSALLHATNYCCGCPRFLPAAEWEGKHGNLYGRCRRDDHVVEALGEDDEWHEVERYEVWRVIPAEATVKRCWLWIQEGLREEVGK